MSDDRQRQAFENSVRRIARELWPAAQYAGAEMVDGRERDLVFETDDVIYAAEATTDRSRAKAVHDTSSCRTCWSRLRPIRSAATLLEVAEVAELRNAHFNLHL